MSDPSWYSVLPPILAIILAISTKQVILSLFAGIWMGFTVLSGFNPLTGVTASLGTELGTVEYVDHMGTRKIVRYWAMEAVEGEFEPNPEVDETKWMSLRKALDTLSYERDRALLRSTMDIS